MRFSITSTAAELALRYQGYVRAWDAAVAKGLRDVAIAVERGATERTTGPGSSPPGDYPVPVRTGTLRRSIQARFAPRESMVIATAVYARAIHDGFTPYGNPNARKSYIGRPFLQDAVDAVDPNEIMLIRLNKELPA